MTTIVVAQTDDFFADDGFFDKDTTTVVVDTIIKGNSFFTIFKGTPGKAAMYSLLIPGGGQIYNHSWWKVPIAIGIDATLLYLIIDNTRKYNQLDNAYKSLLAGEITNFLGVTNPAVIKSVRDNTRKNREYSYVFFLAGHLITVFDAFVDNHLKDFDISDDLSIKMSPSDDLGLKIGFYIPLSSQKYKSVFP